jgi:hypothetical protein
MSVDKHSDSPEMSRFNDALRGVLSVSKTDLNRLLAEDKAAHPESRKAGRKPKSSASVPASLDKD